MTHTPDPLRRTRWLAEQDPVNRITEGPAWLETLLHYYVVTPWRSLYEWIIIAVLALIIAVALLATFEPLYDILQWKGLL